MKLFIAFVLLFNFAAHAELIETANQYDNFNVRNKVVYSVTSGKDLYFKTILISAYTTDADTVELELRDSATVKQRFYVSSAAILNAAIDFDETMFFDETVTLNLVVGNSGSVGASIYVIGNEL